MKERKWFFPDISEERDMDLKAFLAAGIGGKSNSFAEDEKSSVEEFSPLTKEEVYASLVEQGVEDPLRANPMYWHQTLLDNKDVVEDRKLAQKEIYHELFLSKNAPLKGRSHLRWQSVRHDCKVVLVVGDDNPDVYWGEEGEGEWSLFFIGVGGHRKLKVRGELKVEGYLEVPENPMRSLFEKEASLKGWRSAYREALRELERVQRSEVSILQERVDEELVKSQYMGFCDSFVKHRTVTKVTVLGKELVEVEVNDPDHDEIVSMAEEEAMEYRSKALKDAEEAFSKASEEVEDTLRPYRRAVEEYQKEVDAMIAKWQS